MACWLCIDAHAVAPITTTDSVGDAEVALVEKHLRGNHPELLPAVWSTE
jgi:hypothetical protein